MNIRHNTALELEKQERFAEAGYGRLFAYDSLHYNAMVDVRSKAKYIRELNPDTTEDTQKNLIYSGPTVFYRPEVDIKNFQIDKMDLKSAYLAYLINEQIKKPGVFRIKHHGAYPLSDKIVLYVIKFNCAADNLFVKWFLNASAINKRKIKTDGQRVYGSISIFSSSWMNQLKYIDKFLTADEAVIEKSYTFHGSDTVDIKQSQIQKLYEAKERGSKNAKNMLVQSTGWLSLVDRPTYYHMVQYIKYFQLKMVIDYDLLDDNFGCQTDCTFFRVTERTKEILKQIREDNINLANKNSTIGTLSFQRVNFDEIIANKARVVLK